jgi:hypothetical protein
MEDFATAYAVLLHDPQLREGLVTEHERSVRRPANSRIRRGLRVWLVNGLLGLAARVEPNVSSSTDTCPHRGIAIRALISTRSTGAPVLPEGGS